MPKFKCPRCHTLLDEGPVLYRCSHCRRAVPAAELDVDYHARPLTTTGTAQ